MNQEKIGQFIKEIRTKNNLTQKDLANKYHVTYQAVSKWENGKNLPDTALIKQMSKDFNVSLDDIFDGEYSQKNRRQKNIYILSLTLIIITIIITSTVLLLKSSNNFEFKTLSAACPDFKISGNISYNTTKSAIYITNIEYCGGLDNVEYQSIECILYEALDNVERKISSVKSSTEKITLAEFLQDLTLTVENYSKTCSEYQEDTLYLSINATDYNAKTTNYKIPLSLNKCS